MRNFFKYLSHKKIYVGLVSQTSLAGIVVYDTIVIAKLTAKQAFLILKVGPHKKPVWETSPIVLVMERVKKGRSTQHIISKKHLSFISYFIKIPTGMSLSTNVKYQDIFKGV